MGQLALPPSQAMPSFNQQQNSNQDTIGVKDGYVSFIDSATIRDLFMLRYDIGFNMNQPWRAEYILAKLGTGSGLPLLETNINRFQEVDAHVEWAITHWFSLFLDAPYLQLDPAVNQTVTGYGDTQYGFKLCTWSDDDFIVTTQVRIYQPTAQPGVGTGHWSVEPGILTAVRLTDKILVESQLRYWKALGGTDFAGDLVNYGVGISFKQTKNKFWFAPVVECVGWTVINGQSLVASSPTSYVIDNARSETVINGCLGLRFGFEKHMDFYVGYAHAFSGDYWQKDLFRLEMRFIY
jgi:hypothetical protein